MSKSNKTVSGVLAADVPNLGTFVVSYPAKQAPESGVTNAGDFYNAVGHDLVVGSSNSFRFPNQFALTFADANITVTNRSGATWLAGSTFFLALQERGDDVYADDGKTKMAQMKRTREVVINLGAADAAATNNIRVAGDGVMAANVAAAFTGALVAGGVAVLDVPRNVQIASSAADTTQVITIFGTDVYGAPLRENLTLNGTTAVLGQKAFKTVTRLSSSASTSGNITVGTGTRLGLPVFLPSTGHVLRELSNGVAATAGTFVAGLVAAGGSTATTGDVRGTYVPNAAPNNTNVVELIVSLPDAGFKGIPQFNG